MIARDIDTHCKQVGTARGCDAGVLPHQTEGARKGCCPVLAESSGYPRRFATCQTTTCYLRLPSPSPSCRPYHAVPSLFSWHPPPPGPRTAQCPSPRSTKRNSRRSLLPLIVYYSPAAHCPSPLQYSKYKGWRMLKTREDSSVRALGGTGQDSWAHRVAFRVI